MSFLESVVEPFRRLKNCLLGTLGRGSSPDCNYRLLEIPLDKIASNAYQARREMSEQALQELSDSIQRYGIINPIIVAEKSEGQYQLIAGERRVRASKMAGFKKIPALIGQFSEEEMVEISFLENLQREPMNVVDRAVIYQRLRSEFKKMSAEELSDLVGKTPEEITSYDWILELPKVTRRALSKELISEITAKKMHSLSESEQREVLSLLGGEGIETAELELKIHELRGGDLDGFPALLNSDSSDSSHDNLPPELGERAS